MIDKHPFTTGQLLLMLAAGFLLVYGIIFIILKIKK
jgi:hypothetical protein